MGHGIHPVASSWDGEDAQAHGDVPRVVPDEQVVAVAPADVACVSPCRSGHGTHESVPVRNTGPAAAGGGGGGTVLPEGLSPDLRLARDRRPRWPQQWAGP